MATKLRDTEYLKTLVGDALSRGCAAAAISLPNDPVEYLGQWLLRHVKNAEVVGQFESEKEAALNTRKTELEAEAAAAAKIKADAEERREAVIDLSKTVAEPRQLFQKAVDMIVKFTKAGAAYAAVVAEPEEPDWQYPEDPEDPTAVESEDEADPSPPLATDEEGAPAEPEAAQEAEAEGGEGAAALPKVPQPIDYSKCYLSYMAATAGQEFMTTTELTRPAPPPEDDPEAKVEPMPPTFRILDERRPMLYLPNVAFDPSVRFFKDFPKIGAYQACGVQSPSTGEFKAIIAADSLFPESGGQALSQEDQDFVWHVSRALSQAFEAIEAQAAAELSGRSAKDIVDSLHHQIKEIYFPPKVAGEGEDVAAAAAAAAEPPAEPPAEEAPAETEGGEDPVSLIKAELKALDASLHEAEIVREKAAHALEVSQKVLRAVKDVLQMSGDGSVSVLRHTRSVPQATFHALKAVLHVLGKPADTHKNWKRAFAYFEPVLFHDLHEYDATQERDLAAWKAARCCYKALGENATKKMQAEMPDSHLGVLLTMWLKEVRKVARRAAAFRASRTAEDSLHDQLDTKRLELETAVAKKAEDEEAARVAAEEAAAAEAAAAAAEGGEGEEGNQEQE